MEPFSLNIMQPISLTVMTRNPSKFRKPDRTNHAIIKSNIYFQSQKLSTAFVLMDFQEQTPRQSGVFNCPLYRK